MIPSNVPTSGTHVLDVGCGSGLGMTNLRDHGWDVEGFEVDPKAAVLAAQTGCRTHTGSLTDLEQGTFDVIVSSHVIEHVPDLLTFFADCKRLLKPGGTFIAYTPNISSWTSRIFKSKWRGLEPPRHKALLGPRSAAKLCERAEMSNFSVSADPNMEGFLVATSLFDGSKKSTSEKALFYLSWMVGQLLGDLVGLFCKSLSSELRIVGTWYSSEAVDQSFEHLGSDHGR